MTPPMPMERHPWYADHEWLRDWLENEDHTALVAVPKRMIADFRDMDGDLEVQPPNRTHVVLTKSRAVAPAPYVGDPFVYIWNTATDQYGRHVAGEAHIQYVNRR